MLASPISPRPFFLRPKSVTWMVFCLSLIVTEIVAWRLLLKERSLDQEEVIQEGLNFQNRLEAVLDYSSTATYTLSFLVQNNLLGDRFDSLCHQILKQNPSIDALQLVQNGVITHICPIEGNEAALGLDISKNPDHVREVAEAIRRNSLYFEGPFHLAQGGRGIVGRLPIIEKGQFWGLSAVVIRLETLFEAVEIPSSGESENFVYQLSKMAGGQRVQVFENNETFDSGLITERMIPKVEWKLQVKHKNPGYIKAAVPFALLGFFFSVALASFAWKVANQPLKLQKLVDEKTADLQELNKVMELKAEELSRINHELNQYAHVISHDLQEPLRMVVNFMELLKRKYDNELDEQAQIYIGHALNGAQGMRELVKELLQYALAGQQQGQIEKVPLRMILDDVTSILHVQIDKTQATISYEELPVVDAPKLAITQVMQNLIGNALKFIKPDVAPVIRIESIERAKEWEIIVSDNGIGIDKEYQQEIFGVFRRLHSKSDYAGTGVGLAIVQKQVQSMGGRIWVESEKGAGSAFHFTIPKSLLI